MTRRHILRSLIIISISIFFHHSSFSQTLSENNKNEISELARAFFSSIEIYSGPRARIDGDSYNRIFEFFNKNSNKIHAYDLFKENVLVGSDKNITGYLQDIESDYNNEIDVQFKDIKLVPCVIKSRGENYVAVRVKKILVYKGVTKEAEETVFFNIGNSDEHFKVNEVVFSNIFNESNCLDNVISDQNKIDLKQLKFSQQLKQADLTFHNKNYTAAKYLYTTLLEENKEKDYLNRQIATCNTFITMETYLEKANYLFINNKYEDAKEFYEIILKDYSTGNSFVLQRIDSCKIKIRETKYKKMIELGDYYYNKGLYANASEYYRNSLEFIENDKYGLSQIEKCRRGDPRYARNEIDRAIVLAETSKKNWGIAFRIMFEYQTSGLLKAQNYYFMVMVLDGKDKYVREEMDFKHRDFQNYLNIYAAKLRKESSKENYEKGLDFLNYNLNKRYQK